MFSLFIWQL